MNITLQPRVETRIQIIRGAKVILDADLAELYGVSTKALNQAVKRNIARFPPDFRFQLDTDEKTKVVTNCDHLGKLKCSKVLPHAFTEHGAIQVANVLASPLAIEMGIHVVRAFVRHVLQNGVPVFSTAAFRELETRLWKPKFDRYLDMATRRNLLADANGAGLRVDMPEPLARSPCVAASARTRTKVRMISMFTAMARGLSSTEDNMATPCSVKA